MAANRALFALAILFIGLIAGTPSGFSSPPQDTDGFNPQFRTGVFDWDGVYGGILFSVSSFRASITGLTPDPESMRGNGAIAGIVAGYNATSGDWLYGIEIDAGYGQIRASTANAEFKADAMASVRGRVGRSFGRNLLYLTGGLSLAATNRRSSLMTSGRTETALALVAGAGYERVLNHVLTGRLEYLYGHSIDGGGADINDMHLLRASAVIHLNNEK